MRNKLDVCSIVGVRPLAWRLFIDTLDNGVVRLAEESLPLSRREEPFARTETGN